MRIASTIAMLMYLSFPLLAEEPPKPNEHEFSALVSSVRLNSQLISQGKKHSDEVSVSVPTILFKEPLFIADVRNARPHSLDEVNTLIAYTKANIEGSAKDILSFWTPEERNEKAKLLNDSDIFKANREYHNDNPSLTIVGLVFQNTTTSLLRRNFGGIMGVTVKKIDEEYFITDNPSNDLELAIIEASFSR